MRAEIISIGTELLVGSITNTNARYLAEKLAQNAVDVYHQVTVGDNIPRILECLEEAAHRSDLIITSGGLGPTEDDVTLESIALFLSVPRKLHTRTAEHVRTRLRQVHIPVTKQVKTQCYLPQGTHVFQNDRGTAPGLLASFSKNGKKKWLIVLPGPPRELIPLFEKLLLPAFFKESRLRRDFFTIRTVKLASVSESQVAEKVSDLLTSAPPVTTGIYAKPGLVELKVMSKSSVSEKKSRLAADKVERVIRRRLGSLVYGVDSDTLASIVGDLLKNKKITLAIAESCSGGFLSSLVTDVPGSSEYFLGGIISYANQIKADFLGVDPSQLQRFGAVSRQTAALMALGVAQRIGSTVGVAITGIAGPGGGTPKKPVGLVYIAIFDGKQVSVGEFNFRGYRQEIKSRAAYKALDLLRLCLLTRKK